MHSHGMNVREQTRKNPKKEIASQELPVVYYYYYYYYVVRFVAPHIVIVCIVSKARDLCILIVFSPLLIV